jgi:hypothetical protein
MANWCGKTPTHCDYCTQQLQGHFTDGKSPMGQWGIFCDACVRRLGIKLGIGRGQKFELATGKKVA